MATKYIKDDVTCNRLCCFVVHTDKRERKNYLIYGYDKILTIHKLPEEEKNKRQYHVICNKCNEHFYSKTSENRVCETCKVFSL